MNINEKFSCLELKKEKLKFLNKFIKNNSPISYLYVRSHQYDGLDFVLYGIPNNLSE